MRRNIDTSANGRKQAKIEMIITKITFTFDNPKRNMSLFMQRLQYLQYFTTRRLKLNPSQYQDCRWMHAISEFEELMRWNF